MKARNCILMVLFSCYASQVLAQKTGKITGTVTEKGIPLEFVTISICRTIDTSKVIHFTTSDSSGFYAIDSIEPGEYQLRSSLIGYQPAIKTITITVERNEISQENITMDKDALYLQAVTVTAQKKLIEKTPNGFIVNGAANIAAVGGTATDILKNTPTVSVDAEGVITLRGKPPLVLINGRNSSLGNPDQIPASSIESIEIINNPNAKYDANAESGIINIKLKKNKQAGTNSAIALGAGYGSRGRFNSSFLLNHKTNKWNLGVGYDNRFAGRTRKIIASRTNFYLPDEYLINQDRNDERLDQLQNLRMNIDFTPNNKNNFSFEAIGSLEGEDNDESLNSAVFSQSKEFQSNTNRHSIEIERSKVVEFAFDYNRKFVNERKFFTANITTSPYSAHENTDITSQGLDENSNTAGDPFLQKTHNYEDGNISSIKLDYGFPVSSKSIVETGYKGTFRSVLDDYQSSDLIGDHYVVNIAASNIFDYKEQVHAVYSIFRSGFEGRGNRRWKYDLGIRAEQVLNDGTTQNNSTKFSNQYLKFFPNTNLILYTNPDEYLKLSYAKRINRPGLEQLNPFIDITDSLNPHSGNPNLQPEIIHAIEFGYNHEWSKFSIISNLFYRYGLNSIRQYSELQPNGANLSYPVNIGSAISYGLENIISGKVFTFYEFNASLTLFRQKLDASNISEVAVQSANGWNGKLINNFVTWKGGKLQVTGSYNSAVPTPQGKRIAQYFADLGFQQKLGKANARISLTVTDIFNTFKSGYNNSTVDFSNYRYGKADTRAIILTFAWFFNSAFKEKLLENNFSTDY